ncbi:MAG: ABC transporter ATP-binding protein [Bdellovibrionaceae bacterium]|nr:ABC transporter ATP-binding protein [Pseudobdellovibrionaceae bacterium]
MTSVLMQAHQIRKSFPQQEGPSLTILHGLDLQIGKAESVAIVGGSGAGKSTFLQILGTLDNPTSGEIIFEGQNVTGWSDQALADFRNQNLGFVFQFHHLLQEFTALENVMIPCRIRGMSTSEATEEAQKVLRDLGLGHRLGHYPSQLSGGEQQRVAIARALVLKPKLILADEPTGNLDARNTKQIQHLFQELVQKYGTSIVVVTHDLQFAAGFDRVIEMKDGMWEHLTFA